MTLSLTEHRSTAPAADTQFQEDLSWPAWFRELQAQAWTEFLSTPAPTRLDEAWRFSNLRTLELSGLNYEAPPISTSLISSSTGMAPDATRLIFSNHTLIAEETSRLPKGVVVAPLKSAIYSCEDLIREYLMKQPVELGSHKYALWHKARLRNGVLVYVPPNTTVEVPIEIFSWLEGDCTALFPHTLIICGENSRVTVLDHFRSASNDTHGFVCGVNDLHLAAGAEVTYAAIQDWDVSTRALHLNSTLVPKNAKATVLQMNFGARSLRSESLSRLAGPGARSLMLSLSAASGTREIDQRTLQDHTAPHTSSDLLYHNTLEDSARTIFSGLIRVEPHAHQTDAYQKVRNLLLSDNAEANSMPGLEILADNVRCTHGATSSQISDEELFYMQARGIPPAEGHRLIANGFLASVLERLDNEPLREFVMRRLR